MNKSNVSNNSTNLGQMGFSTGHGSVIKVSDIAMQKATKLLCDIYNSNDDTQPQPQPPLETNRTENIEDDGFPPFEFSCSEINEVIDSVDTFMNTNCPINSQSSSSGFELSVSDTNDDNGDDDDEENNGNIVKDESKVNCDINVSELMPDDPCLNDFMDNIEKHENESETNQELFDGEDDGAFSIALMDTIETPKKVDEKRRSPKKSKMVVIENLPAIAEEEEIFNTQLELSNENVEFMGGFRTAAGQKLEPTEQALNAAKQLFANFDWNESENFDVAKESNETSNKENEHLSMILSPIPKRASDCSRKQLNAVHDCGENLFHSTPKNKRDDENCVKKRKRLGTGGVQLIGDGCGGDDDDDDNDNNENATVKKRLMCDNIAADDSNESYHKIQTDISQLKEQSRNTGGSRSILLATTRNDSENRSQICLDQHFIFKPKTDLKSIETSYRKEINEAKMKISLYNNRLVNFNLKMKIIESPPTPSYRKPKMGHLLKTKLSRTNNRLTLEHLNEMNKIVAANDSKRKVSSCLKNLTIENVSNFHFILTEALLPGGIFRTVDDNFTLIPNVENRIGLTEIELAFKSAPAIDPSLLPKRWLDNHFKQVVWKLTAYERFFPAYTSLNLDNVMLQLKYRYDREIDRAERSALRKILEKDEPASRRLVLCVSSIIKINSQISDLMLTDGWYSIRTVIDPLLVAMVHRRKIFTGLKLIIHSAELVNCSNGCNALEIPDDVRLKIFYNCTRRARWTVKLGFQKLSIPFPITLQTIKSNGGPIGRLTVLITRIYPEKFLDSTNNSKVWRNKKAEESYCNEWENLREIKMQEICEKMQQNFENSRLRHRFSNQSNIEPFHKLSDILCKRTLCQILYNSNDPEALKEKLTEVQLELINDYWSEYVSNVQSEYSIDLKKALEATGFEENRNVRSVLTIRVTSVPIRKDCNYLVTFWSNQYWDFREGQIVTFHNLVAKENNLLSSTTYTKYEIGETVERFSDCRKLTTIVDLLANNLNGANEFDTIGFLVKLDIQNSHQIIWLADISTNLLLVRVNEGTKTCLLISGLKIGECVAILNLQWRSNTKNYAQAMANHFTLFSNSLSSTGFGHLKQAFQQMSTTTTNDFLNTCKTKIKTIVDD